MDERIETVVKFVKDLPVIGDFLEKKPKVVVIRFSGIIADASVKKNGISHSRFAKVIDKAFGRPGIKAVAMVINSPGGSAAQTALIASQIRDLANEKEIPVYAFVEDVAASGGYWLASIIGFTVTSALCGMATSLPEIVAFRLLQGVFGAGLIPLSQAVLLDTYPKEQHGQAMALWGVGVMLGPILGPTLGGWLTEYYNWRWIFYINVPIGILTTIGVMASMSPTPPDKSRPFDFLGFALLAVSIGMTQLFLDRGQGEDWFSSTEIIAEATIAGLCLYLFIVHMMTTRHPFLEPGIFKDRNYVTCLVFMFLMGVLILAVMALLPTFLQNLMGYPILTTGIVLAPRGVGVMVGMMVVGRIIGKIDVRLLILFGLSLTAASLWEMSKFNLNVSEQTLIWTGLVQGLGMGFIFIPLSTIAYATLDPRYRNEATALFSLIRNIGSSIGVSVVIALLVRNTQINHAELAAHLSPFSPGIQTVQAIAAQAGMPQQYAGGALQMLNGEVTRQAAAISYLNDFRLIMVVTLVSIPLLGFIHVPRRDKTPPADTVME